MVSQLGQDRLQSTVNDSAFRIMKELRVQHSGNSPIRAFVRLILPPWHRAMRRETNEVERKEILQRDMLRLCR